MASDALVIPADGLLGSVGGATIVRDGLILCVVKLQLALDTAVLKSSAHPSLHPHISIYLGDFTAGSNTPQQHTMSLQRAFQGLLIAARTCDGMVRSCT